MKRVAFRIALIYFVLFAFCDGNGTIFSYYGSIGDWIDSKLIWPMNHLAEFFSLHVFHFTGVGSRFHDTGSGDTLIHWVLQLVLLGTAILGGLIWTGIATARGSRRKEYQTLYAWLRFLLRLTCGMFMLNYGMAKLIPMQMAPISIAILNEPVGNMSPMTFLWALIGMNPHYQMICGGAEVVGGILLLYRRTALAGALLSAFVMTNVLLYNIFFDVPVKLFAANLLLALLFITLPDVTPLFRFFWLHQPAAPVGVWVPPVSRRNFRLATQVIEIVFVVTFAAWLPFEHFMGWRQYQKALGTSNPLLGAWRIDADRSTVLDSPEHQPITDLYVDNSVRAFTRSTDGSLWRTRVQSDPVKHTIKIGVYTLSPIAYGFVMPDHDHATLTALPPADKTSEAAKDFRPGTLQLIRVPVPSHYPLLERGLHWVNEWGLER
jgi:hypothetical protein